MIHIYYAYINKDTHEILLEKFLKKFSPSYQNKIMRLRRWQDAQLSIVGRLLLILGMKSMNENFFDFQMGYTEYGKPFFIDSNIKFNISHSGILVVSALSDAFEVGIDVEYKSNIGYKSFKSHMTMSEWKKVNSASDSINAFYNYWTKKEAVIKALGKGLSISLKSFEIIDKKSSIDNSFFSVKELSLDENYKCNLAIMTKFPLENLDFIFSNDVIIKQVSLKTVMENA